MSKILENLFYTESHEWIRMEGETAVIGITDHAQNSLGDIVFLNLPEVGDTVTAGSRSVMWNPKKRSRHLQPVTAPSLRSMTRLPMRPSS